MEPSHHFDIILIGTGAGGGTLLRRLAPTGKRILVLERGGFLPRSKDNWNYHGSFQYYKSDSMLDREGKEIYPGLIHYVGGATKVYGAALFRLRERDFESYAHKDGISPAWQVSYQDFEPYYTEAESLYQVHGQSGDDPTEPHRSAPYPHPPLSHETRIGEIYNALRDRGIRASRAPMGIQMNEARPHESACVRCDTCDGYPCLVRGKSDAEVCGVLPALKYPNVTLITHAKAERLLTNASGLAVTGVEAVVDGKTEKFTGDIVVASCGAIHSAALLLRSSTARHPEGLANRSGQVGRNLMKHVLGSLLSVSTLKANPTAFQKTLTVNDFYWGESGYDYPMGNVQLMGRTHRDSLNGQEDRYTPLSLDEVAANSIDWWLTTEDVPKEENRITLGKEGKIVVDYTGNNEEPFDRLVERWTGILKDIGCACYIMPRSSYAQERSGFYATKMPVQSLYHQVGTCRFGTDPDTSVLDTFCKAHDLDNLYVVDGSFFPSSGAVNPSLTIIANALRVGDHLKQRLCVA